MRACTRTSHSGFFRITTRSGFAEKLLRDIPRTNSRVRRQHGRVILLHGICVWQHFYGVTRVRKGCRDTWAAFWERASERKLTKPGKDKFLFRTGRRYTVRFNSSVYMRQSSRKKLRHSSFEIVHSVEKFK